MSCPDFERIRDGLISAGALARAEFVDGTPAIKLGPEADLALIVLSQMFIQERGIAAMSEMIELGKGFPIGERQTGHN